MRLNKIILCDIKKIILIMAVLVLSTIFAYNFNCVYENIKISAINKKNIHSNATDIYLSGFYVKGEFYDAKATDGTWMLWNGYQIGRAHV